MTAVEDDDSYQGTWELVEAKPRRIAGRKDGTSGRDIVDTVALRRLVHFLTKNVDERIAASLKRAENARDGEGVG